MAWFFSAGTRLHYNQTGDGPLLVLLHDGFFSSESWAPVLPLLSERFCCLSWDRSGYGKSAMGMGLRAEIDDGVNEFTDFVDHLEATGLDTSRLLVCGHCMGGAIAARWAAQNPHRVAALALEATGIYSDALLRRKVDLVFQPWEELPENLRQTMARMHGPLKAPEVWNFIVSWDGDYIAKAGYDLRPTLAAIACPTLVVTGDKDVYFKPDHTRETCLNLAKGELWIPVGIGHDVHRQIPEEFAERLARFFEQVP